MRRAWPSIRQVALSRTSVGDALKAQPLLPAKAAFRAARRNSSCTRPGVSAYLSASSRGESASQS